MAGMAVATSPEKILGNLEYPLKSGGQDYRNLHVFYNICLSKKTLLGLP
tara:strand:+ start:25146 stop:25292 length:147 start_codon:yes stop_codon:yes gene_type:complete